MGLTMKSSAIIAGFLVIVASGKNLNESESTRHKRAVTTAHVLTDIQKKKMLDKHNELRRIVQPEAANMLKMRWHDDLERLATKYTRKCLFVHNKNRNLEEFSYVGENLHVSTSSAVFDDDYGANAVIPWDNEKAYYDYESRSCQSGKVCGHYTQTAWAESLYVGCGMTTCDQIVVFGKIWKGATVLACNYAPGGNYGGKSIYEKGFPCSRCPSKEYWCENKLCTNSAAEAGSSWAHLATGVFVLCCKFFAT